MSSDRFSDLSKVTKQFAGFVVEAQRIFDRRYTNDLETLSPAVQQMEAAFGLCGASTVLPRRIFARHIEFKTHIALRRSRAYSFALMAKPVNLGFRVSHESEEITDSWICLEFDQLPVPGRESGPVDTKGQNSGQQTDQGFNESPEHNR